MPGPLIPILTAVGVGGAIIGGIFGSRKPAAASKNTLSIDVSNSLKILSETMVENSQTTSAYVQNMNFATLEVGPNGVVNGDINTEQTIDLRLEVSGELDSRVVTNMSSKLITDLQLAADQAAKSTSEWFSTSRAAAENVSSIKNALEQAVTDRLEVRNRSTVIATSFNTNEFKLLINGVVNGDVNIKQGIVADIIALNIMQSIINRTNQILQQSDSKLRVTQASDANAKGLSSVMDGFMNGVTISSIVSAVILCLIVVSLLFVALSPAGQKGLNKASNAAAARYGGAPVSAPITARLN